MTLPDVAYHRATSLADACRLGEQLGSEAAFLAGGTELLPDYLRQRESARHLIALDGLSELRGIAEDGDTLVIGGLTSIAEVAGSPLVRSWFPALAEAARAIGSPFIRSRATIGGNFCRAVPCADTPPAAVAAGARVRLVGPLGTRELEAGDFIIGPRQTALVAGEVLTAIAIPRQPAASGGSYQRFARRKGAALAVAAVAARVVMDGPVIGDVRLALGAVAPVPMLAARAAARLRGERPSAGLFALAGDECAGEALPITDVRATAEFRRDLVRVLARRALAQAVQRAEGTA
ncbi:MAG: Carbon monoxide dehydrogenase medium chain [Gemmatimonadaceae bacterium]|nr:Carbon monoxide dehydrogenase medium chain [Gemmatimonadaceae bacterium]